jgi:xanthine dehydrogenase accessory factor
MMDVISRVTQLLERGKVFCLATVIKSTRPDIPAGQKAIVFEDGGMEQRIGSGEIDSAVRTLSQEAIGKKGRHVADIGDGVRVFFDVFSGELGLLICGAGHIALPLARFGQELGFRVTVLDDRSDFAVPSRFPGCEVIAQDFVLALRDMPLGPSTYAVVITRGHEHDVECLAEILRKETAYTGLIGSRRRVRFVLQLLRQQGISPERLKEVFTPIGVPIGAESPEEIALSIAAELVCMRRKGRQQARALRSALGGNP